MGTVCTPEPDAGPSADGSCGTHPQSRSELENACTKSQCFPFDNGRLTKCKSGADAGLTCPPVPAVADAGPDAAPDAAADASPAADADVPDTGSSPDAEADAGAPPPPCSELPPLAGGFTYPKSTVYATGSTALSLYIGKIGQALANSGKATVIYQLAGSCFGPYSTVLADQYPLYAIAHTATYFDPVQSDSNGVPISYKCSIDDPDRKADVGISDVFAETCLPQLKQTGGLPNNLHDFYGPIQTMVLAVPAGSTQTSISADAAYMVWGFGSGSGVAPWTDEAHLLQRSGTSGTQSMMAAAIGVDPFAWHGVHHKANQDVLTDMLSAAASADAQVVERTLGVMGADFVEDNRAQIKALAYRDRRESCGYYPDSTATAHDKRNVRDGHYPVWGPSHFIVAVDGNEHPLNPAAQGLVDALAGTVVSGGLDLLQTYAQRHVVPQCAMHVIRTNDGGDYSPYKPPASCSCYYDYLTSGSSSCTPCKTTADCAGEPGGATNCNQFGSPSVGFCEP